MLWWPPATWPSPTRRSASRTTSLPLLAPMSEVAGRMAPLVGAHHLMRPGGGRGVLVCGVPGVRCARVVILGAGVAGFAAATMAVGMHSEVFVLDRNLDRLRTVDHHFRGALETIASSEHAIEEVCLEADIVIGAVLVVGARAPTWSPTRSLRRCATGRFSSTSPSIRAGASSRPARPRILTPLSRCTGPSSTAWPTCPVRCRTHRPTRWPTPRCPTCRASPTWGGRTPFGPIRLWPKASTWRADTIVYAPVADAHGLPKTSLASVLGEPSRH